ncbi:exodeoxyribonuclease I [Aliidiomarina sedimenti]|uniref:Exodeoxyribonuclease I n=1 Tax=Aliidiomarina sedimenti TaxID=1933879 RepID=A0ABY0C1N2_9GAMM|nr:exodeoxyribonuclease I [Aliidiomarina sedimenti]RUO31696.1 exodeoxyribonuclease I [Aliidiomarina sedimenti]
MTKTLYWYDFEAGGANPRVDRPSQFAGIRTDESLNIIGEPLVQYCQPSPDYLPHPEACLITAITPQKQRREGRSEAEFCNLIEQQFSQPDTTIVGYNNVRFDDEMTRVMFYRNFHDPYAYSWQNNNSRWDLVDLVRACYALRPDGIEWPTVDGRVSFKLELLSKANGIEHGQAHDAMSDVYATIGMAKRIKEAQPRLYDFYYRLRRKAAVQQLLDEAMVQSKPLVHVSSYYGTDQGNVSWIMPVAHHPTQANAVIAWRLDRDPQAIAGLTPQQLIEKLYTPRDLLGDDEERPGLVVIVSNKCPFVAPVNTLSSEQAERFALNWQQAQQHLQTIQQQPALRELIVSAYAIEREQKIAPDDVEMQLYSGPFFSAQAKSQMEMIRHASPEQLATLDINWDDPRFAELLFRYRARNYPQTLNQQEVDRWRQHCRQRLTQGTQYHLSVDEFVLRLEQLAQEHAQNDRNMAIIKALAEYIQEL